MKIQISGGAGAGSDSPPSHLINYKNFIEDTAGTVTESDFNVIRRGVGGGATNFSLIITNWHNDRLRSL